MIQKLKNTTAREWMNALERDGFKKRKHAGSHHIYQHPDGRRILLVYHAPGDTFGPRTIKQLLAGTLWTEEKLRDLNLIK